MRAVDVHVHLPTAEWVCGCVGDYLDSIERYFGHRPAPHSMQELTERYEALDLVGVLLGWDAERATGKPPIPNEELATVCAASNGRFVGFGSVDPARPDALERLARFPELGLRGVKLHPTLQDFDPADDRHLPFFDAAAELGLVVLTHTGTSGLGAGEPGGQGLRIDHSRPLLLDRIAARHPGMPILLAHTGWPWHLEALAMALHKRNVYLDISGWKYRYLPEDVRREMARRLRGQFCFGTDYPMFDPAACLEEFERLELPADVAQGVLRDNALALLGSEHHHLQPPLVGR
jgi:predicted TIM-barrel fold metal-dependent hydrolase